LLPGDFPHWEMIYRWFAAFRDEARFPSSRRHFADSGYADQKVA